MTIIAKITIKNNRTKQQNDKNGTPDNNVSYNYQQNGTETRRVRALPKPKPLQLDPERERIQNKPAQKQSKYREKLGNGGSTEHRQEQLGGRFGPEKNPPPPKFPDSLRITLLETPSPSWKTPFSWDFFN